MQRSYTLFVTHDELLASQSIGRFKYLYDLTLRLGSRETVNFLLQERLSERQRESLEVTFDPFEIELASIRVTPYHHQTLVTVELQPKELGTIRLRFTYPDNPAKVPRRSYTAPFTPRRRPIPLPA